MAARARASSFLGDERQDTRPPPHTSQSGGSCRSLRTCLSHMGPLHKGSGSHLHSFLSCMHQCIQSWHCGCDPARDHPFRSSGRSEEHTSELQSLMRISYAVFCLKKKKREQE